MVSSLFQSGGAWSSSYNARCGRTSQTGHNHLHRQLCFLFKRVLAETGGARKHQCAVEQSFLLLHSEQGESSLPQASRFNSEIEVFVESKYTKGDRYAVIAGLFFSAECKSVTCTNESIIQLVPRYIVLSTGSCARTKHEWSGLGLGRTMSRERGKHVSQPAAGLRSRR